MLREYDMLFNTLPDNNLAKTDRVSMANSLEIRCTFVMNNFNPLAVRLISLRLLFRGGKKSRPEPSSGDNCLAKNSTD
jgi:hypothetical protein